MTPNPNNCEIPSQTICLLSIHTQFWSLDRTDVKLRCLKASPPPVIWYTHFKCHMVTVSSYCYLCWYIIPAILVKIWQDIAESCIQNISVKFQSTHPILVLFWKCTYFLRASLLTPERGIYTGTHGPYRKLKKTYLSQIKWVESEFLSLVKCHDLKVEAPWRLKMKGKKNQFSESLVKSSRYNSQGRDNLCWAILILSALTKSS